MSKALQGARPASFSAVESREGRSVPDEPGSSSPAQVKFGRIDAAVEDVERAIGRSRDSLLARQHPEGYWVGELEGDSMLEADYIFVHVLLGTGDPGKMQRALNEIMRYRNDDGSWSLYPGGPGTSACR